jgi:hypothetical protein
MNSNKQFKSMLTQTTVTFDTESSSDDSSGITKINPKSNVRNFNEFRKQKPTSELHLFHVNALSLALAGEGFSYGDVMKIFQYFETVKSVEGQLPSRMEEVVQFAETVDKLRTLSETEISEMLNTMSESRSTLIDDYSSLLHSLGVTGITFVDPELSKVYTISPEFERFFNFTGSRLSYTEGARTTIRFWLKDIEKVLNQNSNDDLIKLLSDKMIHITGISMFLNCVIIPKKVMSTAPVSGGTAKSSTPLPFSVLRQEGVSSRKLTREIISRSVQDLTGRIPVNFSKTASCSQGLVRYSMKRYDAQVGEFVDKSYFGSITVAADGYCGDRHTLDLFQQASNSHTYKGQEDLSGKHFAPVESLSGNYYTNAMRTQVNGQNYENDNELFQPSQESDAIWVPLSEGKSVRVSPEIHLVKLDYSSVGHLDFPNTPGIKVMNIAGVSAVMTGEPKAARKHAFFLISASSQTVLAIPKRWCLPEFRDYSNSSDMIRDPQYIFLWPGIIKKLPMLCSAFFVSVVLGVHANQGHVKDLAPEAVQDIFLIPFSAKVKNTKGRLKTIASIDMARTLFSRFWVMEFSNELISVSSRKVDSLAASNAVKTLDESLVIVDHIQESDEYSDSGGYDEYTVLEGLDYSLPTFRDLSKFSSLALDKDEDELHESLNAVEDSGDETYHSGFGGDD